MQGVTRDYRGLHRVIKSHKGYKVLQGVKGVTMGYLGLPEVTRGYRRLQGVTQGLNGVTRGCKGLQGIRRGFKESQGLQDVTGGKRGYKG